MSDSFRHSSVESHFFIILFLKCFAKAISAHTYLRKNELHSVRTSWTVKNAMSIATSVAIYDTSKLSYPLDTSANNKSNKIETPFAVHGFANLVKSLLCVHRILSKKGNICSHGDLHAVVQIEFAQGTL